MLANICGSVIWVCTAIYGMLIMYTCKWKYIMFQVFLNKILIKMLAMNSCIQSWICLHDHINYIQTMVVVSGEVLTTNVQVMIFVQLPEFAVNYIEMLIWEEICNLINIILLLQQLQCLKHTKYKYIPPSHKLTMIFRVMQKIYQSL